MTSAVGAGRAGVHLVVDEVVQLQEVHEAHGHRTVERVARAAVVERRLRLGGRELQLLGLFVREGQVEHHADLLFARAVEHGGGKGHAVGEVAAPISMSSSSVRLSRSSFLPVRLYTSFRKARI